MSATAEEILDRFRESWIATEKIYNNLIDSYPGFNRLIPVYIFIQKLRDAGQDKFFRLGSNNNHLIFSRAIDPELRADQKFLKLEAKDDSYEITLKDAKKMYRQYKIKDLEDSRLTGLFEILKETLVD
ncbi:MAG: hypothetical protein ACOYLO_01415 [Ferruginibacter sp.]